MKESVLTYKEYVAEISFSPDDEVFYGKIIGLNDFVIFESNSADEIKKTFIEAVEDYLETRAQISNSRIRNLNHRF